MGVLGFQSHDACGGNVRGLMFNISAEQRYGAENTTANCRIIDHFSAFESGLVALFLYAA
jgi:hypothetical protein